MWRGVKMKCLVGAVSAFLCFPAFADGFEPVTVGNWNVFMQERGGCVALNRPISELENARSFGVEPVHVLGFIPESRDKFGYMVFFWPGANSRSVGMDLNFDFGAAGSLSLPDDLGMPSDHGAAGRLTPEALAAFTSPLSEGILTVSTQSGEFRMIFDITDVPKVFEAIAECTQYYE